MDFATQALPKDGLAGVAGDALLVVVAGASLPAALDAPLAAAVEAAVAAGDLELKPGKSLYLHHVAGCKVQRIGVAATGEPTLANWRKALAAGFALFKGGGAKRLAVAAVGIEADAAHAEVVALAAHEAAYLYRHTKPSAGPAPKLGAVTMLGAKPQLAALEAGLVRGDAVAVGVTLARECANRPGNHMTPTLLAEEARRLAREHKLHVEILDRKDCEKLGMGSYLAVAQASHEPPKFIVLRYQGAGKNAAPIVLVGKGITFDTGGVSLKPAAEMDEMKFDMGGAASVLGTFRAVAELAPKVNLVGLIPACENMPGGGALKPGDVVTSMSGQTIEVLNTDAEGRLILCDALTYAERYRPAAVVDIATLTGACVIALGHHRSGLFTTDERLAAELLAAGEASGDPAWRLPLDDEYDEALKSGFADMANVGSRAGGAITAAMFLKRYTARYPWAHLDIAGTAWKSGQQKGGTGRPVPLLTHFVLARAG